MIALLAVVAAAAATTPLLTPSTKWAVDYRPDMCMASRGFGPAGSTIAFALQPPVAMGEDGQQLFLLTQPSRGGGSRRGEASITPLPSGQQTKLRFDSWATLGNKARAYEMHADADLMAALAAATGLTVTIDGQTFALETGKIQPVLDALKTCNDKLFRSWGVDPAAMAVPARGISPASWFPPDSYPAAAKQRNAQGKPVIVLTVAGDGRATACRVAIKADPDLDDVTCRLAMRNGRFEKSVGPADRYAILAVRWWLER